MQKVGKYQSFGGVNKLGGILRRSLCGPALASTLSDVHGPPMLRHLLDCVSTMEYTVMLLLNHANEAYDVRTAIRSDTHIANKAAQVCLPWNVSKSTSHKMGTAFTLMHPTTPFALLRTVV